MKFAEVKIDSLQDVSVLEAGFPSQVGQIEQNVLASLGKWKEAVLSGEAIEAAKFAAELQDSAEQAEDLLAIKAQIKAFKAGLVVPVPVEPEPTPAV